VSVNKGLTGGDGANLRAEVERARAATELCGGGDYDEDDGYSAHELLPKQRVSLCHLR